MDIVELQTPGRDWRAPVLLFVLALLLQLPLVLNPGYYSFDELQWAAYADIRVGAGFFHGVDWFDFGAVQYRPLTFNLWLWLSHHLFATPFAFHGVLVAWGAANAVLLQRLLVAAGSTARTALLAALLFAVSPFAVFVHGWVATIADLAWLTCALGIALVGVRARRWLVAGLVAWALTTLALLAKEAALSIPAMALVAAWLLPRERNWRAVLAGSGIAALAYLALRYGQLLFAPKAGNQYDWSVAYVPMRWLEYQLFVPSVEAIETSNTTAGSLAQSQLLLPALLWLALLAALRPLGWRWVAAFLAGGVAALGPVLVLGTASNQYGYGFIAFECGLFALAWPRLRRWGRAIVLVYALFLPWHGANVMRLMHHVGVVQARYSPAMAAAVAAQAGTPPVRLALSPGEEWLFLRLSHEIPAYRGVAIGDRVRIVAPGEAADYLVEPDGSLLRQRQAADSGPGR